MTNQMKQARDEKARTYAYNNAIYIDKAMLNKEGYQYLEEKPAKDFKEGTDWYRNNVWHSTIEDPEERKDILLMYKTSDGRTIYHIGLFDSRTRKVLISQRTSFPWQQITNFEKWAYLEDLSPDTKKARDKTCMYAKDEYSSDDRVILCKDCEEKCRFNNK